MKKGKIILLLTAVLVLTFSLTAMAGNCRGNGTAGRNRQGGDGTDAYGNGECLQDGTCAFYGSGQELADENDPSIGGNIAWCPCRGECFRDWCPRMADGSTFERPRAADGFAFECPRAADGFAFKCPRAADGSTFKCPRAADGSTFKCPRVADGSTFECPRVTGGTTGWFHGMHRGTGFGRFFRSGRSSRQ